MKRLSWGVLVLAATLGTAPAAADGSGIKLEGYAEWRADDGTLIVDGQRVRLAAGGRFKGKGEARSLADVPLGYEIKVDGTRAPDGTVVAKSIEAKPNGDALFEGELRRAFDAVEREYVRRGRVFDEDDDGRREDIGRLERRGPRVERARRIFDDLLPPYADPDAYRVYVVDNEEWNAMAAPNGAIFVFSGLMDAADDDELAVVLGHELAHATHEHSRKSLKKDLPLMLAMMAVVGVADAIDDDVARVAVQLGSYLTYAALSSGHGRHQEDQADRTGLRYAYEAGYDVSKAPGLWHRFAEKYGNGNKVVNFFFSDHSQSTRRAANLQQQIAFNYVDVASGGIRMASRQPSPARPGTDEQDERALAGWDEDEDGDDRWASSDDDVDSDGGWESDDEEWSDDEDAGWSRGDDRRRTGAVAVRRAEDASGHALVGFTVEAQGDRPAWTVTEE